MAIFLEFLVRIASEGLVVHVGSDADAVVTFSAEQLQPGSVARASVGASDGAGSGVGRGSGSSSSGGGGGGGGGAGEQSDRLDRLFR